MTSPKVPPSASSRTLLPVPKPGGAEPRPSRVPCRRPYGGPRPPRPEILPRNGNSRWKPTSRFPVAAVEQVPPSASRPPQATTTPRPPCSTACRRRQAEAAPFPSLPSTVAAASSPRAPWTRAIAGAEGGGAGRRAEKGRGQRRGGGGGGSGGGGTPRSGDWRRPRPII